MLKAHAVTSSAVAGQPDLAATDSRAALSARLARALAVRGIHYGWVMVGLAFLFAVFTNSSLGVPSVLIVPMSKEFGWSIGDFAAPQALRFTLYGLVAPFAGGLMLRYGPRRMLGCSGLLLLAGLALTLAMTARWQLWLGMGIIFGVAPGITALQLASVIASRWFVARRGLVLGLLGGATATGTLVFMPLAAWIAEHWGWRAALLPTGAGVVVCLMLFVLLGRDRPQELGQPAYGETVVQPVPPPPADNFVLLSLQALGQAVRRPVFWVLAFTFFICGASSFALVQTHFAPFCGDIGLPLTTAAGLLALVGVCDLFGTLGSGWLSDRVDNRWLLAWYYALRGVSLLWLVCSDVSVAGLTIFAVIYGLDFIATVPPTVKLTVGAFGREIGPAVVAWIFAAHQIGVGLFTYANGVGREMLGSYLPDFFFAGLLCLIAAMAFTLLRKSPAPVLAARAG